MIDIEALLESDAAAWQRHIDRGAIPTVSTTRNVKVLTSRRPHVRRTVFAAAVVAIIVAGGGLVAYLRTDQFKQTSSNNSQTYNGLTLRFPTTWKVLHPSFANGGVDSPIAYLTNAKVSNECPGGSCQGPVAQLGPAQVFISILQEPFVRTYGRLTEVVAGQPARIRTGTTPLTACPQGATEYINADIALRGPQEGIAVDACIGAAGSTQLQEVRQMLATARYK